MRTHDLTAEQTIAESRLRSITAPERRSQRAVTRDSRSQAPIAAPGSAPRPPAVPPMSVPPSFAAFRTAIAAQAPALDPGRPGLRVLLMLGVVAAVVAGVFLWRSQPAPEPLVAPSPLPPLPMATPAASTPTAQVTVHVTGKVRKPGVYTLPVGARVTDAVTAAGGARQTAAAGSVNLARRLVDGEQIVVGAPAGPSAPGMAQADPAAAVLDLNAATADQLEQLPGVGEVLAARIAEFRTAHGGFTSVDQLREVSGIGPRTYDELKGKVRV
ncbi:helix-hairpin-helix domain-containing protein [Nonomuraea cavernae]|uniref:helix-hairpin-helix domain-containing protein n=1 Tax=Nonomuraea cavernae TaxID=2045107 RepID=UPI0034007A24